MTDAKVISIEKFRKPEPKLVKRFLVMQLEVMVPEDWDKPQKVEEVFGNKQALVLAAELENYSDKDWLVELKTDQTIFVKEEK